MRQFIVTRYSFGWYPTKLVALLNAIAATGWSTVNAIAAGLLLESISGGKLPSWAGIIIISFLTIVIGVVGYKWYERFAFLPLMIVFLILLWKASPDITNVPNLNEDRLAYAGSILSYIAAIIGFAAGWFSFVADYNCNMPEDTNLYKVFFYTFSGLYFPMVLLEIIGLLVASTISSSQLYAEAFATADTPGVVTEILKPLGGFGTFCVVLLALSSIATNIPNDYSLGLCMQVLGPSSFARVKRYWWTLGGSIVYVLLACFGAKSFSSSLSNFLLVMGYWGSIYATIVLTEDLLFRRMRYDVDAWNSPEKLPHGIAAACAFVAGAVGAVMGMAQVWFIGPIAAKFGPFGGDLGCELGVVLAFTVYVIARPLEANDAELEQRDEASNSDSDAYHGPARPPPSPPKPAKAGESLDASDVERRSKRPTDRRSKENTDKYRDTRSKKKKRRRSHSDSRSESEESSASSGKERSRKKRRKEKSRRKDGHGRGKPSKKHRRESSAKAEEARHATAVRTTEDDASHSNTKLAPTASLDTQARRVLGPAPPPPELLLEMARRSALSGPDIGPAIGPSVGPSAGLSNPDEERAELEEKIRELERRARGSRDDGSGQETNVEAQEDDGKPKRGDWMLIPPEPKRLGVNLAPNLFKNRGFSQTGVAGAVDQSGWTESPQEKEKRFREEAQGKTSDKKKASLHHLCWLPAHPLNYVSPNQKSSTDTPEYTPRDLEQLALSSSLNARRGPSLMDAHQAQRAATGEKLTDAPREWDRERDLNARRVDPKKRQEMLAKAKELGDRFGHGTGGGTFL
ncbi:hypothetical protein HDU93_008562 [Gonapodya sp. JEL0774]|nr:hypothetical protein HDU93_008562 [Gonapodya sp. JEL0774]